MVAQNFPIIMIALVGRGRNVHRPHDKFLLHLRAIFITLANYPRIRRPEAETYFQNTTTCQEI
jgi:hypothetical protein